MKKALTVEQAGAQRIKFMLSTDDTKRRFQEMLGKKSAGFMSSLITAVSSNKALAECEPSSILSAAAIAASMDLQINPSLGMAAIVPYRDKGVAVAQFQIMTNGFKQLAIRSAQYRTMHSGPVFEGMMNSYDHVTGEIDWNKEWDGDDSDPSKAVGWVAYLKLLNGFEKTLYMTVKKIEAHAKRYSKAYQKGFGPWKDNFPAMAEKTVIKLLLSKWGLLTIDIQQAIQADQARDVIDGQYVYDDAVDVEHRTDEKHEEPKEKEKVKGPSRAKAVVEEAVKQAPAENVAEFDEGDVPKV